MDRWDPRHYRMKEPFRFYEKPPETLVPIQPMINKCTQLIEVNFGHIGLSHSSINYLVENLTPTVEKLCLGGLERLNDHQIKTLVRRCTKIKKLDLRRTAITERSVISITKYLDETLENLDVSYTKIKFDEIVQLGIMPRIKVLNCRGNLKPAEINCLEELFSNLSINQDYCHFANSDEIYHPRAGFWEIETKQYEFKGALKGALKNSTQRLPTE